MTIKSKIKIVVSLLLLSIVYGCALFETSKLSENELVRVYAAARLKVLEEMPHLTDEEKIIILETNPDINYCCLTESGGAQYLMTWTIGKAEYIGISGQGDIFTLQGADIQRVRLE